MSLVKSISLMAASAAALFLSQTIPAVAAVHIAGNKPDRAVISNAVGDWHSPAAARYELDWFAGGSDAGQPADRLGYRLFGGSEIERADNELSIPINVITNAGSFVVKTDVLAIDGAKTPLRVLLDNTEVGAIDLFGAQNAHLSSEVAISLQGISSGYHLLRIINPIGEQAVFIDSVDIDSPDVVSTTPLRSISAGGRSYVLPKSQQPDGAFRLWQFGRYMGSCVARRSYDREQFILKRERLKLGGQRKIGGVTDAWHVLYDVERDPQGRQLENWAMMDRAWSGDMGAMQQIRNFQISFDSPVSGEGKLVMNCIPRAEETSVIFVVNGDRRHARIGAGQKGVYDPGGLTVDGVQEGPDVQPGKALIYDNVPIRKGRNTFDFDYEGAGFLWPGKTYRGLSENFDFMELQLKPDGPVAGGTDVEFVEAPLAGKRFAQTASVEVDLGTKWAIRGKSEIPKGLFGLTTYNAGAGLNTAAAWAPLKAINIGAVNGGMHAGATLSEPFDKDGKRVDMTPSWEAFEKNWLTAVGNPDFARVPLTMARELGVDSHCWIRVLGAGINQLWYTTMPVDIEEWSDNVAHLVRIVKKHSPSITEINLMHEDEPVLQMSHLLRDADPTKVSGAECVALMERRAMEKVHREFPDVKLNGPMHWGPPFGGPDGCDFVGDKWNDWTKPYLEIIWGQLGTFNCHNYFHDYTHELTGEAQSLVNYMRIRFGAEKPIHFSEGHLSGGEWSAWTKYDDRALWLYDGFPILRSLMFGVKNMDKVQELVWHDYCQWPEAEWATSRATAPGLPPPKPRPDLANDIPMPLWNALWLYRNLRGTAIQVNSDPGTEAFASYDGKGYSVVALNGSPEPRQIEVKLRVPSGRKIASVQVEFAETGDDFYRYDAGKLPDSRWRLNGSVVSIDAKPLAGYHVRVVLDKPAAPSRVAGLSEYFGDQVAVTLGSECKRSLITIACPESVRKARKAWLRVAYESLLLEPTEVKFILNGREIPVNQRYFSEVPIDPSTLTTRNQLAFLLRDHSQRNSFRVRSATIVTEN